MQDYHGNFTIGRRAIYVSEEPFNGTIDEIKIWNYALTQEEAEEVYNQNAPQIFSLSPFRKFWNFIKNLL